MTKVWFATGLGALTLVLLVAGLTYHPNADAGRRGAAARRILYYRDPMHPSYTSPRPGKAPDCGMDLEPVYAPQNSAAGDGSGSSLHVYLEHERDWKWAAHAVGPGTRRRGEIWRLRRT